MNTCFEVHVHHAHHEHREHILFYLFQIKDSQLSENQCDARSSGLSCT